MKRTQFISLWFLPLILIGGLFVPWLGYLVLGMMMFFLPLSFFKARWWCWNLCPRGAFLDIVLARFSRAEPVPKLLTSAWFRWTALVMMMSFLVWRLVSAQFQPLAVAVIFVVMCWVTTLIAIVLGLIYKQRCWCMFCPMGFFQENLGRVGQRSNKKTCATPCNH